eukprot:6854465-Ditylum_brightwellii.AAC.1
MSSRYRKRDIGMWKKLLVGDEELLDIASPQSSSSSNLLDNKEQQQSDTLTNREIIEKYFTINCFSDGQEVVIDVEAQ